MDKIEIFDLDGTLTYVRGDIPNTIGFDTYAFWPLISQHFVSDINQFNKMVVQWEDSMKIEQDPTTSSHEMMQKSIDTFFENITAKKVRDFSKKITLQFIQHNIIRHEAIAYLEKKVRQGVVCILSTGSYEDGALGFVDALVESKMISKKTRDALFISGAIVNWEKKFLIHANIRERKLRGIEKALNTKVDKLKSSVSAVYADDPWVNDRDILLLAPPEKAYVIVTANNRDKVLPDRYVFTTWASIVKEN